MRKILIGLLAALVTSSWANGAYGVREWDSYDWQHNSNVDEVRSIASITKLFTAVVVVASGVDLNQPVKVSGTSTGRFPNGIMVPRIELMRAMLISSDNRAAESLANAHPGGRSGFLRDARDTIGDIGLKNTKIVEPTGLSPMNISTVEDLSDFLFWLRNHNVVRTLSSERTYQTKISSGKRKVVVNLRNTNPAVFSYDNILVSKTGTTNAAGKCVAMLVEKGGSLYTVIVLGQKNSKERTMLVEGIMP